MRRERLYLSDIAEASDHIATFITGVNFEEFLQSELLRSAVVHKLTIIGEAAARVSDEFRGRHSQVPWLQIVAFRNILVHGYFGILWDVVWRAAQDRCPELREQINALLLAEPGSLADQD